MKGRLGLNSLLPLLGFLLAALWLFVPLRAQALTPAGTVIGNAATATYYDEDNNQYTTTSNLVQTTVAEVCGVSVTGGGDYEGVPGQTVYVPFTVKNTGNGENTFNATTTGTYEKTIYLDENQNGVADPGESAVTQITLGMGETASLVVAVKIPADASEGDSDTFDLTLTGTDPSGCSDSQSATVTVVNDALIQANKQVDKDTAEPGDTLEYTVTFRNVGTKAAKAVDNLNVDLDGDGSVETGVEGLLVWDAIPNGTVYVDGSAEGEPASVGYPVYSSDGSNWYKNEDDVSGDIKYVGFFIPDQDPQDDTKDPVLDPDQQGTLTFKVQVDGTRSEIENTATVKYAKDDGTEETVDTNTTRTQVPSSSLANVAVGPRANTAAEVEEDNGTNWQDDNTKTNVPSGSWVEFTHSAANKSGVIDDVIELEVDDANTSLPSGAIVEFWNADGTAKLIDTDGDGKVDLGTLGPGEKKDFIVKVFIPAGEQADKDGNVDYYVTVLASSKENPSEVDRSRDNIDGVVGPGVDIGKAGTLLDDKNDPSDNNTDGTNDSDDVLPSDNGTNGVVNVVDPGDTAVYPIEIANTGSSPDQFDLSASQVPQGATAKFYTDPNCDGDYSDGEQITETQLLGASVLSENATAGNSTIKVYSVAGISANDTLILSPGTSNAEEVVVDSVDTATNTITLKSALTKDHTEGDGVAEKTCVVMVVETTSDTPPGEYNVVVEATSDNSGATDSIDAYLKVNPVCTISLSPEHSDQLPPGGTTTYQHIISNNGNTSANVTITVPSNGTQLGYTILDDSNNVQGTSYTVLLNPGESKTFYVKVSAPSDVAAGTVESIEVTAEADIDGDNSTDCTVKVVDTTTIIEGYLQLTKSAQVSDTGGLDANGACTSSSDNVTGGPCDTITYSIEYKNIGEKDALNVVITDQIPDHTTYVSNSLCLDSDCDGNCDTNYTDASNDDQAEYDSTNNLVRFRVGNGANATVGGTVVPGGKGCVIFKVKIE